MAATSEQNELLAELLDQLAAQFEAGETPSVDRLAAEHPDVADELRGLWATMQFVDQFASSAFDDELDDLDSTSDSVELPLPTLPDYEFRSEVGRGGMGIVYKARQLSLDRTVAIKMLLRGELATERDLARFRIEAAAAARLTHPNIVSVHEVGDAQGQPYFSMEYIDGTNLARRIATAPLSGQDAAKLLVPICRAIAHAHQSGVLHRDLKPSNILIDHGGTPYVSDFGLAKRVLTQSGRNPNEDGSLTETGAIVGTPGYMAPEQAAGQRGEVGTSADVYSLGAILYAAVTGRAPFQAASPVDAILMILEQDPPPPRVLNPQVDPDLEMIILKALQKPADLRYATADELADDLERFLQHKPVQARSSQFSQILSRAFRPTHHVTVLENWGLLWMWHAVVLLVLCLVTNALQLYGITSRIPYLLLWTGGLGTWALIFWDLRHKAGPVTFVERQIAHVWAASMACSTALYLVESLLGLPVLKLSPVLPLIAGAVFVAKAGILSGEFYLHAVVLFVTCIPMALFPRFALTVFGIVSAATFFFPGLKFYRLRRLNEKQLSSSPVLT